MAKALISGFMDEEGKGVDCDITPVDVGESSEPLDTFRARMQSEGVIRRATTFSLVQRLLALVDAEPDDAAIRDALRIVGIVCRVDGVDGGPPSIVTTELASDFSASVEVDDNPAT